MNTRVILNGVQLRCESRRPKKESFEYSLVLAIAPALAIEPEVFGLDAPTAHLDKNALILLNKSTLAGKPQENRP